MAKKPKSKPAKEAPNQDAAELNEADLDTPTESDENQSTVQAEPESESVAPSAKPSKVSLHSYARANVVGWREHWWGAIEKHAKSRGTKDQATVEQCRAALTSWGATLR